MRVVNTIIFDLDGTLIDTRPQTITCVNYALIQINEPPANDHTISNAIGLTLEDTFRTILHTSKWNYIDQCVHLYRMYQRDHPEKAFENVKLYPTVQETLGQLAKYYLAIATSKPAGLADQILRLQGIRQFFSTIVGIDDVSNNKPAADMIFLALSRLSSASGAMMVGDTLADIQAGKKAQLLTCAVEYGYTPKEILAASQPDFSISIFCDLLNILGDFA